MMGLQEYFSEDPMVYHIEGAACATAEHEDSDSDFGLGNSSALRNLWP